MNNATINQLSFMPNQFDTLDKIADCVEAMLSACGLPGRVCGGLVLPDAVWMKIRWLCNPAQVDKCTRLNSEIRRVFGCHGGVDAKTLNFVLTAYKTKCTTEVAR